MARVYNFSAGPSMLPEEVLKTAAEEMMEYGESGQSVMEMSHRSKEYQAIFDETEANLREIMNIPDDYEVLFLQGGASTQFAMVPLNLMTKNGKADYIITGQWANKDYKEQTDVKLRARNGMEILRFDKKSGEWQPLANTAVALTVPAGDAVLLKFQ